MCFSFIVKMGLQRGSEWDHVIELHGYEGSTWTKNWKCKYCQNEYTNYRTKSRAHLIGDRSKQIAKCVQVPVEVMRMFFIAPSFDRGGSSQYPIPSHTPTQYVQQASNMGGVFDVASNVLGLSQKM
jgi:hypothetical protein